MILAHIFLPAMLLVICRTQQVPAHASNVYGNEESVYNGVSFSETPNASRSDLLDRYRQLTAKSLLKLYDSCKVNDFLQTLKRELDNDIDDDDAVKSTMEKDHQQHYINTLLQLLEKQQAFDNEASLLFPSDGNDVSSKSALYYYVTISVLLQDKELDEMIGYMLYEKCCRNDVNFFTSPACSPNGNNMLAEKRNTIKKVKFHSWGGKRSAWPLDKRSSSNVQSNVRMPANAALAKDLSQSKIVIRTPFQPWGGRK